MRFVAKAKGKKKPARKPRKKKKPLKCKKCGASTGGKSTLCFTCVATEIDNIPESDALKVAGKIKDRLASGDTGGPVCPFCRISLDWQNCKVMEYEVTIYVREKIHYCPACRAFLGVSSWHTEG